MAGPLALKLSAGGAPGATAARPLGPGAVGANATFAVARNFCEGDGAEHAARHATAPRRANEVRRDMDGCSRDIDWRLKSVGGSVVPRNRADGGGS